MHRLPPGAATGIARNLVVALIVLVAFLAGLACRSAVAQQCTPAGGGPPCETEDGVASLGDPDGSDLTVGNPFHPVTGNKYQEEQDVPPLPGFLGLEVRRHFNAAYVSAASPWGKGWSLSYDTRLHRHAGSLQIVQADGRRLVFRAPEPAGAVAGRAGIACAATAPGQGELFAEADGYRWLWPQQRELLFDSTGKLVKVRPRGGSDAEAIRIEHDPTGRIIRVTDPAGRSLTIDYDANGHLSRIDHPLGRWQYRIHADGRLETVTGPDGVVRRYRYDDPGHRSRFTALAIQAPGEAERLVAQWSYDTLGRVVRYRRGDGGLLHMDYDEPPSPSQSSSATASSSAEVVSVLTNALGARTRYTAVELAGRWRVTEIAGPGCEE